MALDLNQYPFRSVLSFRPLLDYLKRLESPAGGGLSCPHDDVTEMVEQVEELNGPIEDLSVLEANKELVQRLMSFVFPPVFWDTEPLAAVIPFSVRPVFVLPRFQQLFLDDKGDLMSPANIDEADFIRGRIIRAYLFILEKVYGIHQDFDYPIIRAVSDPDTGLDRYYKFDLDFRFVDARARDERRELTPRERDRILRHLPEPEVYRDILPPEDFELSGFTVIHAVDVTESEVISKLESDLIDRDSIVSEAGFQRVQERLRTLFQHSDLVASVAAIQEDQVLLLNVGCDMTDSCIFTDSRHVPKSEFEGSMYERAVEQEKVLLIPDLLEDPSPRRVKDDLMKHGIRSLIVAPLYYKGDCIGTLDLGSPRPNDLGPFDAMLVSSIQPLFAMALKRAEDDLDNRVQRVIKEKCTAIHPAVEWRFRKAALNYLERLRTKQAAEIEAIVFKDVYPLYGVTDIRGSTYQRNRAVQKDLSDHLELALDVIQAAHEARPLLVLDELADRIRRRLDEIREGLGTGDEVSIVRFLKNEVEAVFPQIREFGLKVIRAVEAYQSAVDDHVGTIYGLRKDFEDSVSLLNERLTHYLDQEEEEAQAAFPHYFERHRTDGVDYLIYMGGSLLEQGNFHELYLQNMRLWQLKVACGMAWQTEKVQSQLKVPLETAHLVLVQTSPHAIRFRYDEKRFDVDGAYDIRHEIIKSRLDKAVVKGTSERLTQPGKVAVVYSSPDEADEILRHIQFLRSEGYLTGEVERFQLEDVSGVQGLGSFRVSVNLASKRLSERISEVAG